MIKVNSEYTIIGNEIVDGKTFIIKDGSSTAIEMSLATVFKIVMEAANKNITKNVLTKDITEILSNIGKE